MMQEISEEKQDATEKSWKEQARERASARADAAEQKRAWTRKSRAWRRQAARKKLAMALSAQIQKMSPRHEAILNFILANPTARYSEVAAEFRVTLPWLSTIIHSHAFQEQLHRRHEEIFDSAVLCDVKTKLNAAVDITLDKYMEKVPNFDADQAIDASNKLLGRLGFGTGGRSGTVINADNVQINNGHVAPRVLEAARNRIGADSGNSANTVGAPDSPAALSYTPSEERTEVEGGVVRGEGE